ncbi:tRNA glutamyl-Q(34) synthetase GluQRS [Ruegeria conchae]|uniref:Glutamyl-Q tRNA(Asp) synthetase n=1 Tax=Ruegeria conchae TaxID=981384 RepID=A0A497ZTK2_9RHOB|nr:tRNA glutamyl-Q(34) synthetase GluQRS [Ruegeria conchae]RLK10554.1 glutamyl-Q tRNA(Asp) synthetase [Ruegeria conchae]
MRFITRFAPSPTGLLHLGHAYSALLAHDQAQAAGGEFHLRIEDVDQSRSRLHWENQIYDDLHWLGLTWPQPVMRQSDRIQKYRRALETLIDLKLVYPCQCKRADIEAAAGAPQEGAPQFGPDGRIYPGTCRQRLLQDSASEDVLRLNMEKALEASELRTFRETGAKHAGTHSLCADTLLNAVGDIILVRRNMGSSYHLSVVVDDADQDITHVVRGEDLFDATQIHVLLQGLLGLPTPVYHHHRLIRDEAGKRLAKRDDARAISLYRDQGITPAEIRTMVGL